MMTHFLVNIGPEICPDMIPECSHSSDQRSTLIIAYNEAWTIIFAATCESLGKFLLKGKSRTLLA